MFLYVFFFCMVIFYGAVSFELLSGAYIIAGTAAILLITFAKLFLSSLEKKYYYSKKYLWNLCIGMFLLSFFVIGFVIESFGYINFIAYFIIFWALGPTFFFFGLKTLFSLKIENGEVDDEIIKKYVSAKKTVKTLYFFDAITLLLYVLVIWKRINNGF